MSAAESEASGAYEPSAAMRWLLAALSLGAGTIHLVMVPQHAQESLRIGLAFAAAGWFQIAFGVAMLARPARLWVRLAIAANAAFVAMWVTSRTVGLPDWTGDGGVEDASPIDVLCVAFEVGIVVGALALLAAPTLLASWKRPVLAAAAVVPAGILVATTAVLSSPSAADHAHDTAAGDHAHTGDQSEGHEHGAPDAELAGGHHHDESTVTYDELPDATRAEVDQVMLQWADRYPTAADATRDGWFMGTRSLYGIGAHYIRGNVLSGAATFDLLNPNILLFDGDGPDARFAGVSYEAPRGRGGQDVAAGVGEPGAGHEPGAGRAGPLDELLEEPFDRWPGRDRDEHDQSDRSAAARRDGYAHRADGEDDWGRAQSGHPAGSSIDRRGPEGDAGVADRAVPHECGAAVEGGGHGEHDEQGQRRRRQPRPPLPDPSERDRRRPVQVARRRGPGLGMVGRLRGRSGRGGGGAVRHEVIPTAGRGWWHRAWHGSA